MIQNYSETLINEKTNELKIEGEHVLSFAHALNLHIPFNGKGYRITEILTNEIN